MYLFATCNVNIWHEIQISMWILASFIVINIPLLVALKLAILLDSMQVYRYIGIYEKKIERILYLLVLLYPIEVISFLFLKNLKIFFFFLHKYKFPSIFNFLSNSS